MSHELRTPMNGITGMATLLQHTVLTKEQDEYVDSILVSSEHLLTVIGDILDFGKIDNGTTELDVKPVDLITCVEQALEVAYRSDFSQLRMLYYIDPKVPAQIMSDSKRLRQILVNLIANACKFTVSKHSGDVSLTVRLTDRASTESAASAAIASFPSPSLPSAPVADFVGSFEDQLRCALVSSASESLLSTSSVSTTTFSSSSSLSSASPSLQPLSHLPSPTSRPNHRSDDNRVPSPTAADPDEVLLEFCCKDTGVGIAPSRKYKLFKPFSQGDSSTSREYGGSGLGLAISARLAALLGGRMWVTSDVGKGSSFYFSIQAHRVSSSSATINETHAEMQDTVNHAQAPAQICAASAVQTALSSGLYPITRNGFAPTTLPPHANLPRSNPLYLFQGKTALIISSHAETLSITTQTLTHWGFRVMTTVTAKEAYRLLAPAISMSPSSSSALTAPNSQPSSSAFTAPNSQPSSPRPPASPRLPPSPRLPLQCYDIILLDCDVAERTSSTPSLEPTFSVLPYVHKKSGTEHLSPTNTSASLPTADSRLALPQTSLPMAINLDLNRTPHSVPTSPSPLNTRPELRSLGGTVSVPSSPPSQTGFHGTHTESGLFTHSSSSDAQTWQNVVVNGFERLAPLNQTGIILPSRIQPLTAASTTSIEPSPASSSASSRDSNGSIFSFSSPASSRLQASVSKVKETYADRLLTLFYTHQLPVIYLPPCSSSSPPRHPPYVIRTSSVSLRLEDNSVMRKPVRWSQICSKILQMLEKSHPTSLTLSCAFPASPRLSSTDPSSNSWRSMKESPHPPSPRRATTPRSNQLRLSVDSGSDIERLHRRGSGTSSSGSSSSPVHRRHHHHHRSPRPHSHPTPHKQHPHPHPQPALRADQAEGKSSSSETDDHASADELIEPGIMHSHLVASAFQSEPRELRQSEESATSAQPVVTPSISVVSSSGNLTEKADQDASNAPKQSLLDKDVALKFPVSILIAEDQSTNRKLLLRMLEKLGYSNVPAAVDGQEVVDMAKKHRYDIIFMDVQMPEKDGMVATREICQHYADHPQLGPAPTIIAVTANAMPRDKEMCLASGMSDYISKPILAPIIVRKIRTWGAQILQRSSSDSLSSSVSNLGS